MRTSRSPVRALDRLDRKILAVLQADGRISMKDLAEAVGLTITPCIERVKRLERDGVIMGYYARLNPALLGSALLVFVKSRWATNRATCSNSSGAKCCAFPRCSNATWCPAILIT